MASSKGNLRLVLVGAPSKAKDPDALEAQREFRALRMALWSSQLEASIGLGIGRATVERYEAGSSTIPAKILIRMRRMIGERRAA